VAQDAGRRIIVVCNEGYSCSLAAASLQQLRLHEATDLVGGYQECWPWPAATRKPKPQAKRASSGLAARLGLAEAERSDDCRLGLM
jgi:hypothetical protein